jgi:hypothetical protein
MLLHVLLLLIVVMLGVPRVLLPTRGAKRRRGNEGAKLFFVASPDHGGAPDADRSQHWVLRGFCAASSIEAIDTPSLNQQKIIDEMELGRMRCDTYEVIYIYMYIYI